MTKLGDLSGSGTLFDSLPLPKLKGHFTKFTQVKRNNAIIKPCASAVFFFTPMNAPIDTSQGGSVDIYAYDSVKHSSQSQSSAQISV